MAEKTFHSITLPGQDTARVPLTAAEFSTSVAYTVKDYCTYQGKLYRCTTTHAAGAWNAAHFTATDIDAEFDRKLDIPASQASAPANPRVGDLWIDNDENSPIYNVDASPTLGSTNAVQSGGTKVALNSLDSRKMEHGVITGDFSASVDYRIGDLVFYATTANGITTRILYRCTTDHNAAAWDAAHFTATTLEVELQKIRESEADTDMIGDLFGAKSIYVVGDYCVYNDNLYRCIRAVDNSSTSTPAFDPDDWVQVKLANDVSDLNSALNDVNSVFDSVLDINRSPNKWNPSAQAVGVGLSQSQTKLGDLVALDGYTTSGFIPAVKSDVVRWDYASSEVSEGTLLARGEVVLRVAEYDSAKKCLLVTSNWTLLPYTVQNDDAAYIRVTVTTNGTNSIIFGNTSTERISYIPYNKVESNIIANIETEIENIADFPFSKENNSPIFDFWFDNYDTSKKYRLDGIGRNYVSGSNEVHYVRIYDDSGTQYLLLNVRSASYTEKTKNNFSVNGLTGAFWINWNMIDVGSEYLPPTRMWFSDLCYSSSEIRTDIKNLQTGVGNIPFVCPEIIYGVVGHPFSIYFYNIFQLDSIEDVHFNTPGANSKVQNLGDRLRFLCDEAGTHTITFNIRKNNTNNIISKTITVNIIPETIPTIKAIFIGDSFIDGGKIQAELKSMMGNNIVFYGTRAFSTTDSNGITQSGNDEGRSGWSLENYLTLASKGSVSNAFWDGTAFNFTYYIQNNLNFADVTDVFILSGPNDYGVTNAIYKTQYETIVNSIKAYSNAIRIHCMMPLTCCCLGYGWGVRNYNSGNEFRYAEIGYGQTLLNTFGGKTGYSVIPTHVYFDKIYDFPRTQVVVNDRTPTLIDVFNDNVHPNEYGYFCMADMVFGDIIANCQ